MKEKKALLKSLSTEEYRKNALAVLYLIRCAFKEEQPDPGYIDRLDPDSLMQVAASHSLTAAAAYSLRKLKLHCKQEFLTEYYAKLRTAVLLEAERKKLFSTFSKNGIRYLPLKGAVLAGYYPALGLREMGDTDILIEAENAEAARGLMLNNGYRCVMFGKIHHDVYDKEPFFHVEIHRDLFDKDDYPLYYAYYRNLFDRLKKDDADEYHLYLSGEAFYIYHILHAWINYDAAGIGLRELVDMYILTGRFGEDFDRKEVERELERLGVSAFERELRKTTEMIFFGQPSSEHHSEMLDRMIFSGTTGTYENLIERQMQKDAAAGRSFVKLRYAKERMHLSERVIRDEYPFFHRHRRLAPLLRFYRPLSKMITKPVPVFRELLCLIKTDKK